MATLLMEKGADPNVSTDDFRTPLVSAISQRNESMIRQLMEAGGDVNVDGGYPLVIACQGGKMHIVKLLVDAGAEIHSQQKVPGYALQRAAMCGHLDVCQYLVSLAVDVNSQGGEYGYVLWQSSPVPHVSDGC